MIEKAKTDIAQNYRADLEQFIKGYETNALGLVHGFQKDSIQNADGARINKKAEVLVRFELRKFNGKLFLIVQDSNTKGLTGANYTQIELKKMVDDNVFLDADERLARFTSLNNSGGNNGGGLFGRGKLMYQAVSNSRKYYFDSLRTDNKYYANSISFRQISDENYQGKEAEDFIKSYTGLNRLHEVGTRIIIEDPLSDLVDCIKNGNFKKYIENTWWLLIEQKKLRVEIIFDNNKIFCSIPECITDIYNSNTFKTLHKKIDINSKSKYSITKFFLGFSETEIDEELCGIYIYRKKMKISGIYKNSYSFIPEKYRDRFTGYVEFSKDLEDLIEKNETLEHYGISPSMQYLSLIREKIKTLSEQVMLDLNLKKRNESLDPNKTLKRLAVDFKDFIVNDKSLNFNNFSSSRGKIDKFLTIDFNCVYPHSDRKIFDNDEIKVNIKVENESGDKDVHFKLTNITKNTTILDDWIEIPYGTKKTLKTISISSSKFLKFEENILEIRCSNSQEEVYRRFSVFHTKDDEKNSNDFIFYLTQIDWPNKIRRINTNESIRNISIKIENNTMHDAILGLSVDTHNLEDRKNLLYNEYLNHNILVRKGTEKIIEVHDIVFNDKYLKNIPKGRIELKTTLVYVKGLNLKYRQGEKLKISSNIFHFNANPESKIANIFNDIKTELFENDYERSRIESDGVKNNQYNFIMNMGNPVYKKLKQEEESFGFARYVIEEMVKGILEISVLNDNYKLLELTKDSNSYDSILKFKSKLSQISDKFLEGLTNEKK